MLGRVLNTRGHYLARCGEHNYSGFVHLGGWVDTVDGTGNIIKTVIVNKIYRILEYIYQTQGWE